MTNSFILTPTKLVSVEPDDKNAKGVVAFRDYKGEVNLLDFAAYGETGQKLLKIPIGSKFDAEGCLDIYKESSYLTVFAISSISGVKASDIEDSATAVPEPTHEQTPVAAIASKTTKSAAPKPTAAEDPDFDTIPF